MNYHIRCADCDTAKYVSASNPHPWCMVCCGDIFEWSHDVRPLIRALQLVQAARSIPGPQPSHQLEIQMPQYAKISDADCHAIHALRAYAPADARKTAKREIFSRAKVMFAIPPQHKLLCDVDINEPNHGTLKNKATREPYELDANGKWIGAANGAAVAPKRWFKLDANDVVDALIDRLDSNDADDIEWHGHEPAGHKFSGLYGGEAVRVAVTANGDAYVELAADAYDTEQTEEEDDLPY